MRNKIILVGGYCAAGKTTFARRLSQELTIPCFEKDTIDETLCDAVGAESVKKIDKKSEDIAFALMLHIVERFLQVGEHCILENVFDLKELDELKMLLEKYNCECLLFLLKGNPDVMFDRYVERDKSGERHWIHVPADKEWLGWFQNDMPKMYNLEEAAIERTVVVDATSFVDIDYANLIDIARGFLA